MTIGFRRCRMNGGTVEMAHVEDSLAARAGRLFAQYRDGDQAKMGDLVRVLTPILWHTARSSRLDSASAEDVLQTVVADAGTQVRHDHRTACCIAVDGGQHQT